mgnify:CR=1 FL=1
MSETIKFCESCEKKVVDQNNSICNICQVMESLSSSLSQAGNEIVSDLEFEAM